MATNEHVWAFSVGAEAIQQSGVAQRRSEVMGADSCTPRNGPPYLIHDSLITTTRQYAPGTTTTTTTTTRSYQARGGGSPEEVVHVPRALTLTSGYTCAAVWQCLRVNHTTMEQHKRMHIDTHRHTHKTLVRAHTHRLTLGYPLPFTF